MDLAAFREKARPSSLMTGLAVLRLFDGDGAVHAGMDAAGVGDLAGLVGFPDELLAGHHHGLGFDLAVFGHHVVRLLGGIRASAAAIPCGSGSAEGDACIGFLRDMLLWL